MNITKCVYKNICSLRLIHYLEKYFHFRRTMEQAVIAYLEVDYDDDDGCVLQAFYL
jgi:hypothetical protein